MTSPQFQINSNLTISPIIPMEQSTFHLSPYSTKRTPNSYSSKIKTTANRNNQFYRRSFSPINMLNVTMSPDISPIDELLNNSRNIFLFGTNNKETSAAGCCIAGDNDTSISLNGTGSFSSYDTGSDSKENIDPLLNKKINQSTNLNKTITLRTILQDIGMSKYVDIFEKEEIDLSLFLQLTDGDLSNIGVNDQSDRNQIMSSILDFHYSYW